MDQHSSDKLFGIIKRAVSSEPNSVDFEILEDVKSFWSQTARATLQWPKGTDLIERDELGRLRYPTKLFIKLPNISTNASSIDDTSELETDLRMLWNTEVSFYEVNGNKDIGFFKIPKYYLAEPRHAVDEGSFVLEDMGATDDQIFSEEYIPGFSLDQVKKIVIGIADLHYFCLTNKDEAWKTKCNVPVDSFKNFCSILWNVSSKLKSYDPVRIGEKFDKLKNHFTVDYSNNGRHGYKEKGLPGVLLHQDLNATNILWFKKNGVKEISAFIDFQMTTVGGICEDIIRVLSLGLSAEDRRKHTDMILEEYHARIAKLFNGSPPFTLEQVQAEYKRSFGFVNNFTLFGIACYYGLCKEEKIPADVKHEKLTEYLNRAAGIIDDIILYSEY